MTVAAVKFPLLPLQLGAAATVLFSMSSTAGQTLNAGRLRFANTDTLTHFVTAYTGAAGPSTECLSGEPIAPGDYLDADMPVLGPGGSYSALADAANVVTVTQLGGVVIS